jgi:arabinogalactan endo-1,4-beta-galactosidase
VGNEITGGMLWPDGRVGSGADSTQFPKLAQLLKAAIQGIQNAAGTSMPKIVIHIDRGGDWDTTKWFFDNLQSQGVPFDMIGQSFYPFWHGSLGDLDHCLTNAASRYNKPVIVAETDFPYQYSTNIYGIPATTNGQVQFLAALAQVVKGVPNGLGAGIFWWGTEYQPVSGANQAGFGDRSFFNGAGNVLPIADAFGQLNAAMALSARQSGTNIALAWPLSGAGMSLMSSLDLDTTTGWFRVTNPIQNTGTLFTLTVPIDTNLTRFYRLQSK